MMISIGAIFLENQIVVLVFERSGISKCSHYFQLSPPMPTTPIYSILIALTMRLTMSMVTVMIRRGMLIGLGGKIIDQAKIGSRFSLKQRPIFSRLSMLCSC